MSVSRVVIRSFYKSNDDWDWLQKEDHLVRILKMLLTLSPPGTRLDIHGDETVAVGGVHVQLSCVCILRRLEERAAGQDQIRMLARGDTYTPSTLPGTPDTNI